MFWRLCTPLAPRGRPVFNAYSEIPLVFRPPRSPKKVPHDKSSDAHDTSYDVDESSNVATTRIFPGVAGAAPRDPRAATTLDV